MTISTSNCYDLMSITTLNRSSIAPSYYFICVGLRAKIAFMYGSFIHVF